jgi:hypothetical protein
MSTHDDVVGARLAAALGVESGRTGSTSSGGRSAGGGAG